MISLEYARDRMVAEINGQTQDSDACLSDPGDERFVTQPRACVCLSSADPAELHAAMSDALSRRFSEVPETMLKEDLLDPLWKGLNNAYKRGNLMDPAKQITLDAVVTKRGAVITVSDEGSGFDFAGAVQRFQAEEQYFTRKGTGFAKYHKTRSVISFDDGGSTLHLRFLCNEEPGRALDLLAENTLGPAGDAGLMRERLAAGVSLLDGGNVSLENCRIYVPNDRKDEQWEIKYALECLDRESGREYDIVLTGCLLPPDETRREFAVTSQLARIPTPTDGIRFPEPVGVIDDPSMLLYAFNPSKDLRRFLGKKFDEAEAAEIMGRIGGSLRCWHHAEIDLETAESVADAMPRLEAIATTAIETLAEPCPDAAEGVRQFLADLSARAATCGPCEVVPIHGDFGWNRTLHGDGQLYFFGFGRCRRSHPGFDVGAFLADLIRLFVLRDETDATFADLARERFLTAYTGGETPAQTPDWFDDLPFFTACGMLLRLQRLMKRPQKKWEKKVDALVAQCREVLAS